MFTDCADPSIDPSILCQKVFCSVDLFLVDEPPKSTELTFQNNLSREIADGGIVLPPETGVFVVAERSSVVVIPEVTQPVDGPEDVDEGGGKWQMPVIIVCVVLVAVVAFLFVGSYVRKRRKGNELRDDEGYTKRSLENDIFNDDITGMNVEGSPHYDIEQGEMFNEPQLHSVYNQFEHPMQQVQPEEEGFITPNVDKQANPFLEDSEDNVSSYSDSSGSSNSSSGSSSGDTSTSMESDATESSSGSDESSSTEDIDHQNAVQYTE